MNFSQFPMLKLELLLVSLKRFGIFFYNLPNYEVNSQGFAQEVAKSPHMSPSHGFYIQIGYARLFHFGVQGLPLWPISIVAFTRSSISTKRSLPLILLISMPLSLCLFMYFGKPLLSYFVACVHDVQKGSYCE